MENFLGEFSHTFSTIILWSTYEQLLNWICYWVSDQKNVLIGYFGFLIWFSSVILLSKMKSLFSQPFYQSSASRVTTSTCVLIVVTSVVAHVKLSCSIFIVVFYIFWPFFWLCTYFQVPQPKNGKNQLDFQTLNFMLNLLRKQKFINKIKYSRSS